MEWDDFAQRRAIVDDDGAVLFSVRAGSLVGGSDAGAEMAGVVVTSDTILSAYELQDRVMAALRTQEQQRAENRQIICDRAGVAAVALTWHSNGSKSTFEVEWLNREPAAEEIEGIKSLLRGLAKEGRL